MEKEKNDHVLLSALVICCIILIAISGCMQKQAIKQCQKKGYSYNFCVEHS